MKTLHDVIQRFWKYVIIDMMTGCWNWIGAKSSSGYGWIWVNGNYLLTHRFSYELFNEKIPDGMEIDHLCRNRKCVNPTHLQLVTSRENTLRGINITAKNAKKTHCKLGHPLNGENLYITPEGSRVCKICINERCKLHQRLKNQKRWARDILIAEGVLIQ